MVSVDLKETCVGSHLAEIFGRIFLQKSLFTLVQLNLSTVYSLHLCSCFVQQFSSSSRRWEKLDPTPYVRIMQLIDHKVCRSSFVRSSVRPVVRRSFSRSLVRSYARTLFRSFACRSANSLFLLLEQICNVQLPKDNRFIHISLILRTTI